MHTVKIAVSAPREMRYIKAIFAFSKNANFRFESIDLADAHFQSVDMVIASVGESSAAEAFLLANPKLPVLYIGPDLGQLSKRVYSLEHKDLVNGLIPKLIQMTDAIPLASVPALPARAEEVPDLVTQVPTRSVEAAPVLRIVPKPAPVRLRALVIDDSPTVRKQLEQTLTRMNIQCQSVDGGAAALQLLSSNDYDVIYVDVLMPDMDGYKLTKEIKRYPKHKRTPVIILTSQSSPFDRARGALAGCDTFLTKPVGLNRFYEATTKVLRKKLAINDLEGWVTDPTKPVSTSVASAPSAPLAYVMPEWSGHRIRATRT